MTDIKKNLDEIPSKSQIKNDMRGLQKLGEQLVGLSESQLKSMTLPETLKEAVYMARTLKNDESRRRQMQYIGKLMREVDVAPIRLALKEIRYNKDTAIKHFHNTEMWRDKLISGGDIALNEFIALHDQTDRQQLRTLVRNAQLDVKDNKKRGAEKALFKYLAELIKE